MVEGKDWTHFVGIGGAGMSGLAKILLELNCPVSGSDLKTSKTTDRLSTGGAIIYEGHSAANLDPRVKSVVVSSAIPQENPEVMAARERGLPVIQRAELLARLMQRQRGIAVAGSHGKTTTTSMVSLVLDKNGWDPTVVVGGELNDIGGNAKLGNGHFLVAEADESDGSFLKLHPFITVVTNIENDHLDYYGSVDNIIAAFKDFIGKVTSEGFAVVCADDPELATIIREGGRKYITYGLEGDPDYTARSLQLDGLNSSAEVFCKGRRLGTLSLKVPGRHNILNALAAIATGHQLGLSFEQISKALAGYTGVERRFQLIGKKRNIQVVDDYGHHPTEIAASLRAARETNHDRVIVAFQPHRYTRTKFLYEQFGPAFQAADLVIIDNIYPAGENPIPGVTTQLILDAVKRYHDNAIHIPGQESIVEYLLVNCRPGDLVITMGAGTIWQVGRLLLERLGQGERGRD